MASNVQLARFNDLYSRFTKIEFEKTPELLINFKESSDLIYKLTEIKNRYDKLNELKNEFGDQHLNQASSTLNMFLLQLGKYLPPNYQNIESTSSFENFIQSNYERTYVWWPFVQVILNSRIQSFDVNLVLKNNKLLESELVSLKQQFEKEFNEIETLKFNLSNQLSLLSSRYDSSIDNAELNVQKGLFQQAAKNNNKNAKWWMFAVIISISAIIIVLFSIFFNLQEDIKDMDVITFYKFHLLDKSAPIDLLVYEIIKATLFRVIIISLLIFILKFCIKNFNAQMHQKSMNIQKMNYFDVALALISKASPEGKTKIMELTIQTILIQHKTGYSKEEKSDDQNKSLLDNLTGKLPHQYSGKE